MPIETATKQLLPFPHEGQVDTESSIPSEEEHIAVCLLSLDSYNYPSNTDPGHTFPNTQIYTKTYNKSTNATDIQLVTQSLKKPLTGSPALQDTSVPEKLH